MFFMVRDFIPEHYKFRSLQMAHKQVFSTLLLVISMTKLLGNVHSEHYINCFIALLSRVLIINYKTILSDQKGKSF